LSRSRSKGAMPVVTEADIVRFKIYNNKRKWIN
jgi:hypothetical protein